MCTVNNGGMNHLQNSHFDVFDNFAILQFFDKSYRHPLNRQSLPELIIIDKFRKGIRSHFAQYKPLPRQVLAKLAKDCYNLTGH